MDNRTLEEVRKNEDRLINELEQLQQENEQLKAKIKTYEDPEDLTLMFMYCDEKAKDKIKELKKQLENKYSKTGILTNEVLYEENTKLINRQKEFIDYLTEKIDICDGFIDTIRSDLEEISYGGRIAGKTYIENEIMKNEVSKKVLKEILSKYKSIIGGKDE